MARIRYILRSKVHIAYSVQHMSNSVIFALNVFEHSLREFFSKTV